MGLKLLVGIIHFVQMLVKAAHFTWLWVALLEAYHFVNS